MIINEQKTLSDRGTLAATSPARVDMDVFFEAMQDRYHPKDNPQGKFPMNVAENTLCWELMKDKISSVAQEEIPDWVATYGNPSGADSFREAMAAYLSEFLFGCAVDFETLAFSSGLTSVIDLTSFILANPAEVAIIPAPSYPVYTSDIGVKANVKRFDLQTHFELSELGNGIPLSITQLEHALAKIKASGDTCKMLILTSPDNPTGSIYAEEHLGVIADWCIAQEIHLIVNEIYGLTRIDTQHPELVENYSKTIPFKSFAQIMARRKNPYLHLWHSISKDLGLSGFRVGLVHSYNQEFLQAYNNINMTHAISNYTQWTLETVVKDLAFMKEYLTQMQAALTASYLMVSNSLKKLKISLSSSYGSLFVWMDLSEFLNPLSEQAEHDLWMEIYEEAGLLFTPTNGFGHEKKGLFRIVISNLSLQELSVAMERFSNFISNKRKKKN